MLDWFYENWGSSGTIVLCFITFVVGFSAVHFIEDKLLKLHGRTRRVWAFIGLVLSSATVIIVLNEGVFKYDYARRKFGDDFTQNATWEEIRDKLDENAMWTHEDKTDVDKEINNILFDRTDIINLNVISVENGYHENGTILEINHDLELGHRRSGSDDE